MRFVRPLLVLSRLVPAVLGFLPPPQARALYPSVWSLSRLALLGTAGRVTSAVESSTGVRMATQPGLADIGRAEECVAREGQGNDDAADGDEGSSSSAPGWMRELKRSLNKNRQDAYSRFIQLSTVVQHEDGSVRPACRSVVFRGFLGDSEVLKIITDSRSEKVGQVAQNPYAEVCWYLVRTREQYRISGQLRVVTHEEADASLQAARREQWASLSDNARLQFVWPHPGAPQEGPVDVSVFHPPAPDPLEPPATFCLVLLHPSSVDHLILKGDPQRRTQHKLRDGQDAVSLAPAGTRQWLTTPVNP